jgi:hypothetical protein
MQVSHDLRHVAQHLRRELTLPEGLLWRAMKGRKLRGLQFRKQHPMGSYVLDFYCHEARLCIEVDGRSHGFYDRWIGRTTRPLAGRPRHPDAQAAGVSGASKCRRRPADDRGVPGRQPTPLM